MELDSAHTKEGVHVCHGVLLRPSNVLIYDMKLCNTWVVLLSAE